MGFAFRFAMGLVFVWSQVYGQTDDLTLKSKVGKDLMAAGKFEEAMPVYRELVKALPDNPGPVMNLGMALHMACHEREAVKEFQEVLKLEPAHMPAPVSGRGLLGSEGAKQGGRTAPNRCSRSARQ